MRWPVNNLLFFILLAAAGAGLAILYNLVVILYILITGSTGQVNKLVHYALVLNVAFGGLFFLLGGAGLWLYLRQGQVRDNTETGEAGRPSAEGADPPCTEQMTELVRTVRETLEVIQPLVLHLTARQETAAGTATACDPVSQPGEHLRAGDGRPGERTGEDESEQEFWPDFPKGLNKVTLKQVLSYLEEHNETGVSSEEIATGVGISRVTVRRYMDYLEQIGYVKVDLRYGTVGRPLKIYTLVNLFNS
ncbi:HTH domain-containing protein [Desulfofundulus thermocisternus]|uniref:HTH domain-containing protein n=1 Tax=Desulfofundulus thermocisternus TaxID=42471 RepID=UPI00217CFE00|nr:HTH domain-containing protein [Desulfofundulus thermocisternus]MCS5695119.1 HTH domain-containing protein [Desulfofundulus thermocisternus]